MNLPHPLPDYIQGKRVVVQAPSASRKRQRSPKSIEVAAALIEPDTAQQMLDHNINNRKILRQHVIKLARALQTEQYVFNGDTIVFDKDNVLIDGQHRLTAIIESKKPAICFIICGVTGDAWNTKDQARARRASQAFDRAGVKHPSAAATAAGHLINLIGTQGYVSNNRSKHPSHQDRFDILDRHPGLLESVAYREKLVKEYGASGVSPKFAANHYVAYAEDPAKADEFFERLFSRQGLSKASLKSEYGAIYRLRKELDEQKDGKKLSQKDLHNLFNLCWNKFVKGETLKRLSLPKSGNIIPISPLTKHRVV